MIPLHTRLDDDLRISRNATVIINSKKVVFFCYSFTIHLQPDIDDDEEPTNYDLMTNVACGSTVKVSINAYACTTSFCTYGYDISQCMCL